MTVVTLRTTNDSLNKEVVKADKIFNTDSVHVKYFMSNQGNEQKDDIIIGVRVSNLYDQIKTDYFESSWSVTNLDFALDYDWNFEMSDAQYDFLVGAFGRRDTAERIIIDGVFKSIQLIHTSEEFVGFNQEIVTKEFDLSELVHITNTAIWVMNLAN